MSEWPRDDRNKWIAAQHRDPLNASTGFATRWKPSTCRLNENGYGFWLGHLHEIGQLAPELPAGKRATLPCISAYLTKLQEAGLAPYSVAGRMQQLGNTLRAIAPGQDWSKILRAAARLYSTAKPVRDKRANMQPPEDILQLAYDLMQAADHDRFRTQRDRATLFRDGLMLALLVHRPLRASNFTEIAIGTHLLRLADTWTLLFRKGKVANASPLQCLWPVTLADALDRYLDVHRTVLLESERRHRAPTQALWISKQGTAMTKSAIDYQVRARTEETFGVAINMHSYRHIAATTIATDTPEHIRDAADILWHNSLKTPEKYYNLAGQIEAGNRYHAIIEERIDGRDRPGSNREDGPPSKLPTKVKS